MGLDSLSLHVHPTPPPPWPHAPTRHLQEGSPGIRAKSLTQPKRHARESRQAGQDASPKVAMAPMGAPSAWLASLVSPAWPAVSGQWRGAAQDTVTQNTALTASVGRVGGILTHALLIFPKSEVAKWAGEKSSSPGGTASKDRTVATVVVLLHGHWVAFVFLNPGKVMVVVMTTEALEG